MYGPVTEGFRNGRTMILSGDRGTGKTAIIFDFLRQNDKEKTFVVSVYDFTDLASEYDLSELYKFVIKNIAEKFFANLGILDYKAWKYSKDDREKLAFFYNFFVGSHTKAHLKRRLLEIQRGWRGWIYKFLYQIIRVPANISANAAVGVLSDLISSWSGVPAPADRWRDYFPEAVDAAGEPDFTRVEPNFRLLKDLVSLVKMVGFERVLIIFDKVDEDQRFNNVSEEISDFVKNILTNNKLLTDEDMQIVFSIWSIPFDMMKDSVRTQKIYCPKIEWSEEDLIDVLNKRLNAFSNGGILSFLEILDDDVSEISRNEIFYLANRNPRDLWHILDKIMRCQFDIDPSSKKICRRGIELGMQKFVQEFNFYEYYPRKSNARANSMDIYSYIAHLLKLEEVDFTRNRLNEKAGTGGSTVNYVIGMENIGLIVKTEQKGGSIVYRIRDPKVVYAMRNKIDIARTG